MTGSLPPKQEFHTWKEIAEYLGVSVREAQDREKTEGLPIRRLEGTKPRVWALRSELDEWKLRPTSEKHQDSVVRHASRYDANGPAQPTTQRSARLLRFARKRPGAVISITAVFAAVTAVLLLGLWPHAHKGPVRAEITGNTLLATDETGHTVWRRAFSQLLMDRGTHRTDGQPGRAIQVADLFGDGKREVLFVASVAKSDAPETIDYEELYCFSWDGKILWQYRPKFAITMGGTRFDGPWAILDILVIPGQPQPSIWLAVAHWQLRPGILVSMSPQGVAELSFLDAGQIYALASAATSAGRFILAGGINNEYNAAFLAVVGTNAAPSCSPQTPGTPFECNDLPNGNVERYFVFPPTEINAPTNNPYNRVRIIDHVGDDFLVTVNEANPSDAGSIYALSSSLEIRNVFFNDGWAVVHHRLETAGLLHHDVASCPNIHTPLRIRRWEKTSGWTTVQVPFRQGVVPGGNTLTQR